MPSRGPTSIQWQSQASQARMCPTSAWLGGYPLGQGRLRTVAGAEAGRIWRGTGHLSRYKTSVSDWAESALRLRRPRVGALAIGSMLAVNPRHPQDAGRGRPMTEHPGDGVAYRSPDGREALGPRPGPVQGDGGRRSGARCGGPGEAIDGGRAPCPGRTDGHVKN
jgi:hypothetical protein